MKNRQLTRLLSDYPPSVVALIAANLIPLFGVLLLGWSVFAIMALYWSENVIIGAINVLKMIACKPDLDQIDLAKSADPARAASIEAAWAKLRESGSQIGPTHQISKLFFIPFFIVHYGLFCGVHGVFVMVLFGAADGGLSVGRNMDLAHLGERLLTGSLLLGVLSLAASHLYSFFKNYLAGGEYRRTTVPALMFQPYARVVVLHLAILFGGFATMALGSSAVALLILIVGKTAIDLKLHLREHRRPALAERESRETVRP